MIDKQDGILGLDFGTKKIGVAISHGIMAEPLASILYRGNEAKFLSEIIKIIDEQKVGKVVIGLPLENGRESNQSNWTRQQAMKLSKHISAEVEFVDESYTSLQAIDNLERGDVDSESAKIILEQYLVENKGGK